MDKRCLPQRASRAQYVSLRFHVAVCRRLMRYLPQDYFLQSYDENPYDPLVCLCLAQAYLGRSMQRQSDNRLHQITTVRGSHCCSANNHVYSHAVSQAMAFMSRYRKLMQTNTTYLPQAQIMEEVDYNFGRAFQSLGGSLWSCLDPDCS